MNRRQARESGFLIIFEKQLNDDDIETIVSNAADAENYQCDEYSLRLAEGVFSHLEVIDKLIGENLRGWTVARIPKTALAILRLCCCELLFFDDVPANISINEAVELSKKYCSADDYSFINGVLGSIEKSVSAQ